MRTDWQCVLAVLTVAGLAFGGGCSSEEGDDDDGGSGTSSVGGFANTVGCPAIMPLDASACSASDLACPYGSTACSCDGSRWDCVAGVVSSGGTDGSGGGDPGSGASDPGQACPSNPPNDGDSCNSDQVDLACSYGDLTCACQSRRGNASWACG